VTHTPTGTYKHWMVQSCLTAFEPSIVPEVVDSLGHCLAKETHDDTTCSVCVCVCVCVCACANASGFVYVYVCHSEGGPAFSFRYVIQYKNYARQAAQGETVAVVPPSSGRQFLFISLAMRCTMIIHRHLKIMPRAGAQRALPPELPDPPAGFPPISISKKTWMCV